ncbi:fimbrial protein, partial [Klebsiella quasipneumoniae]|uniref:fimbrial protein n=1 Tax=Klebsiella quasipneumoniae TaxID=1463165 RepID=UPI0038CFF7A9
LLCHGTVCVVGKIRDLILQLSKSSIYSTKPLGNNLVLKRTNGGQEMFPLTARYYQTNTTVTTGIANASATLSLTYQ